MVDFAKPTVDSDGKIKTDGQTVDGPKFPGKPGSPEYIKAVKAHMSQGLNGDQPGQDSNNDGKYKGKGLAFGEGGRTQLLLDKMTIDLVGKGYDFNKAQNLAKMKVGSNTSTNPKKVWDKPKIEEAKK